MNLLELPSELLLYVLEYVGASFFRDDLDRLTICKRWYHLAHVVFETDIKLPTRAMTRLVTYPALSTKLQLFKHSLKTLSIELSGFNDWECISASTLEDGDDRLYLDRWTRELNKNLLKLAAHIRGNRNLRTLRFTAWSEYNADVPILVHRDYLHEDTISSFLSLDNLAVLELDTCGSSFIPSGERQSQSRYQSHICPHIAALLPRLHRLHLRMREICPLALQPGDKDVPYLKTVIVNLSLSNEPSGKKSVHHSMKCDVGLSRQNLVVLMEREVVSLAARMTSPAIVRIITDISAGPIDSGVYLQSLDVLTGALRPLKPAMGVAWDDYGEIDKHMRLDSDPFDDPSSDADN
ncbi:hypothetical protein FQN49_001911 [Arthroderma sp. PD_2]|nr:hypothetical protein FQN49_001911 [Arthroderma sp. PD_2]